MNQYLVKGRSYLKANCFFFKHLIFITWIFVNVKREIYCKIWVTKWNVPSNIIIFQGSHSLKGLTIISHQHELLSANYIGHVNWLFFINRYYITLFLCNETLPQVFFYYLKWKRNLLFQGANFITQFLHEWMIAMLSVTILHAGFFKCCLYLYNGEGEGREGW